MPASSFQNFSQAISPLLLLFGFLLAGAAVCSLSLVEVNGSGVAVQAVLTSCKKINETELDLKFACTSQQLIIMFIDHVFDCCRIVYTDLKSQLKFY